MIVQWARSRNHFCGRSDVMDGSHSGSSWTRSSGRAARAVVACLGAMLAIHGTLLATGCSRAPQAAPGSLLGRFVPVTPAADHGSLRFPIVLDRGGEKKSAMVLVAPIAVKASLDGFRGRHALHVMVVPVFNVGDGIQMDIRLLDDGLPVQVCSRYFDPGRRFEDRRWTPLAFMMDVRSKDAQLEIRVSAGPQGDLVGDWLAFADLRVSAGAER